MAASPEEEGVMRRLAMVSTYPPRRCGLATFTDDLRRALATSAPQWIVEIRAVDRDGLPYGPEVAEDIRQDRAEDYRRAGRALAAAATVEALVEAWRVTGDDRYARLADRAFVWFHGHNRVRAPLYDPHTGGCPDGLSTAGASLNQGAESTLAYHQALLAMAGAGLLELAASRVQVAGRVQVAKAAAPARQPARSRRHAARRYVSRGSDGHPPAP